MSLGERLQAARQQLGLGLKQVEERTGIGYSSLSEFENGVRQPSLHQISTLATFYRKPLVYFLDENYVEKRELVLWRNKPDSPYREDKEAEFRQLAQQYHNLEIWTNTRTASSLKDFFATEPIRSYPEATKLAERVSKGMGLGDYPGAVLYRVLEEIYDVKIFHLDLGADGTSSACFYADEIGPSILLNLNHKKWRRNFDIAHELYHLLVWKVRVNDMDDCKQATDEEKYASHFASCILMPRERVVEAIELVKDKDGMVAFEKFDDIARSFDVSLEALLWRLKNIFGISESKLKKMLGEAEIYKQVREDDTPEVYPKKYVSLATQALRSGEISVNKYVDYLKYARPSRRQAEEILSAHVPDPLEVPASNF
jgi:XRE family transcriptional regulator, fatty acid utilization regulator